MTDSANAWDTVGLLGAVVFCNALVATFLVIAFVRPLFSRVALAVPTARSSHRSLTPQWGGGAVIGVSVLIAGLVFAALPRHAYEPESRMTLVLGAAVLLALVGAVDDFFDLGALPKFAGQTVAVLLVLIALPADLHIVPFLPVWLERALLLVAGLWFVNLVNFMDGIDWMMVAEVVPVTAGIALIAALAPLPPEALVVALALCGAMLGFAPFNRPVARLFLGDMGSLPIGLLIGWLLVVVAGAGHVAAAILLPLYFIADTTVTLVRRFRAGERVWQAHRTHFYQRARDVGLSDTAIVARVFVVNAGLVALAAISVAWSTLPVCLAAVAFGSGLVAGLLYDLTRSRP
jgi:UDP-N-acetylmuramyl pentapeptide phosphotransferase/UDP-N-acetylglucosamine-1-phosphate transferase